MPKESYRYIFDLLDFADDIIAQISPEDADKEMHFMTLVYIEDILDKYGRGLVVESGRATGLSEDDIANLKYSANERMDAMRKTLAELVKQHDFDSTLDGKIEQFKREWRKVPLRGNDSPPIPW